MDFRMDRDKYIALLYCEAEAAVGEKLLQHYRSNGYYVWHDEGLFAGCVWTGEVADAIELCDCVVLLNGKEEENDSYFWFCYYYANRLKKPLLLVHLFPKGRLNMGCRPPEQEFWVLPDDPKLEEKCSRWDLCRFKYTSTYPAADKSGPYHDMTVEAFQPIEALDGAYLLNMRTHEAWTKDRKLLGVLDDEKTQTFLRYESCCMAGQRSYTRNYCSEAEDLAYLKEQQAAERRRRQLEEEERIREEKERARGAEENARKNTGWHIGEFPAGYPYMDEFEYIDSQYD